MNENKICPLFYASPEFNNLKSCECRKDCALFNGYSNSCAIKAISEALIAMNNTLRKGIK